MVALGAGDEEALNEASRKATSTYDQQAAYSAYARDNANAGFDQQRATAEQGYTDQRNRLGGSYARRGLFNSGIYQQGLNQYNQNRLTGLNNIETQRQQSLGQSNLTDASNYSAYQQALLDVQGQRQARLSDLAAQLAGLKMAV